MHQVHTHADGQELYKRVKALPYVAFTQLCTGFYTGPGDNPTAAHHNVAWPHFNVISPSIFHVGQILTNLSFFLIYQLFTVDFLPRNGEFFTGSVDNYVVVLKRAPARAAHARWGVSSHFFLDSYKTIGGPFSVAKENECYWSTFAQADKALMVRSFYAVIHRVLHRGWG